MGDMPFVRDVAANAAPGGGGASICFGNGIVGTIDKLVEGDREVPQPHIAEALAKERRQRWLDAMLGLFAGLQHERIHFLFYDERGEARGNLYFDGCIDAAQFDLALVLRTALLREASSIIVAHNHPGGRPDPSKADIASTLRIIEACKMVGISCADHLIAAGQNIYSFRDQGLM